MPLYCQHAGCSRCTTPRSDYCDLHQFSATDVAIQSSETGAKFNPSEATRKDGKIRMDLVMTGFPKALLAMGECMTWALSKGYNVDDWHNVPDPVRAYTGAMMRHLLKEMGGETHDDESKLLHAVHTAWNAMARLEMLLRGKTL